MTRQPIEDLVRETFGKLIMDVPLSQIAPIKSTITEEGIKYFNNMIMEHYNYYPLDPKSKEFVNVRRYFTSGITGSIQLILDSNISQILEKGQLDNALCWRYLLKNNFKINENDYYKGCLVSMEKTLYSYMNVTGRDTQAGTLIDIFGHSHIFFPKIKTTEQHIKQMSKNLVRQWLGIYENYVNYVKSLPENQTIHMYAIINACVIGKLTGVKVPESIEDIRSRSQGKKWLFGEIDLFSKF